MPLWKRNLLEVNLIVNTQYINIHCNFPSVPLVLTIFYFSDLSFTAEQFPVFTIEVNVHQIHSLQA